MSGLTYMLSYEPNDLFDDVEHEAAIQVATSNIIFLILDVVIVALAGAGLGWTFDPASAIGDLISS
jgi:hypothetical protein